MIDRPRHSVDAPITKTLIALRRVKSLKDPSTNSMTKFAYLFDNEAWDTASSNRISMQFMDHSSPAICDRSLVQFQPEGVLGEVKRRSDAIELESHLGKSMLKVLESEEFHAMNRSDVPKREMKTDKLSYDCVSNSNDCYESESASDSESSNSANEDDELPARDCTPRVSLSRRKSKYMDGFRTTDLMSRAGTPSLSVNDVLSSHNTSLYANEGLRFTENNDGECGITCCWTRTPKLRELGDGEVHPLLSRDIHELTACDGWNRNQIACKQIQKSLDHKFEPKSFDELVGQNVVVKALVGAISTKRIASLYLFHGPRGTGKTSAARLFAASLNCLSLDEHKPCGRCQECVQFYCGRSSDVKEVDSARINRGPRIRSLVKDASNPSRTAKFKVFILDECHMLQDETWMTILNNLDRFPPDVLLVMITPDIDKLPRSAVNKSQQFYFPKIKDADIAKRLEDICIEEGLAFEHEGLDFIASTANGSLRDANIMLDQLSLLGERITLALARELIGVVSDDELLTLLDLALSSDSSSTVIRARDLMSSRIDPMQLVSQLANLIMDLLAGKGQETSETRRSFSRKHSADADTYRLNHALKVLSDTEKQLRVSKNQSTWLTAALLQLSSFDASSLDGTCSKLLNQNPRDSNVDTPNSTMMNLQCYSHGIDKMQALGSQEDRFESLELLWNRTIELCQSNSLKNFLRKRGKLSSICLNQGIAVAELQFYHPDHVSKAEKSWKTIAGSLQSVIGRNVEIRIILTPGNPPKDTKLKRVSLALFNCSKRMQQKTQSSLDCRNTWDISSNIIQPPPAAKNNAILVPQRCSDASRSDLGTALRSSEGNILRTGTNISHRPLQGVCSSPATIAEDFYQEIGGYLGNYDPTEDGTKEEQRCFPKSIWSQKKSVASNRTLTIRLRKEQENKHPHELNYFQF